MLPKLSQSRWSPYWVGIAIGVLSWITFAFMGKALGVSTTFVRAAGSVEKIVAPATSTRILISSNTWEPRRNPNPPLNGSSLWC